MRKKTKCLKCNKETMHHYFMMFPVGYFVCNVCGTVEGDDGKPSYIINFYELPSYECLRLVFDFSGMNWEIDGEKGYFRDLETFEEFKEFAIKYEMAWGESKWGDADDFEGLRGMFKDGGIRFQFKTKEGDGWLGRKYNRIQKYVRPANDVETFPDSTGTFKVS